MIKVKHGYIGFNLDDASRNTVIAHFQPKFPKIIAHHITHQFGVPVDSPLPPHPKNVQIVGYAADHGIEALICQVDGTTKRPDGGVYHVTLSLNPDTHKPVDSNKVIAQGWEPIEPFAIKTLTKMNGV